MTNARNVEIEARELTENERHVLEHTTGARSREPFFRNHFVAEPGHHDWETLQELCRRGLMRVSRQPSELSGGGHVFAVTTAGKEVVREILALKAGT